MSKRNRDEIEPIYKDQAELLASNANDLLYMNHESFKIAEETGDNEYLSTARAYSNYAIENIDNKWGVNDNTPIVIETIDKTNRPYFKDATMGWLRNQVLSKKLVKGVNLGPNYGGRRSRRRRTGRRRRRRTGRRRR